MKHTREAIALFNLREKLILNNHIVEI